MSDIEGKVAREAMSECGQRASFNISESPTKAGHVVVFVTAKTKTEAMRRRVYPRMHHKPLTMHEGLATCHAVAPQICDEGG